jgi:hypothetical protein
MNVLHEPAHYHNESKRVQTKYNTHRLIHQ